MQTDTKVQKSNGIGANGVQREEQVESNEVAAVIHRSAPAAALELSLLELLVVLAGRWRFLLVFTVMSIAAASIVGVLLPDRFTATTVILPPQQNLSSGSSVLAQLGSANPLLSLAGGNLGLKNPNDLQVAMLKSRTVEDAMVDRFNLMVLYHDKRRSDARMDFEKATDIEDGVKDGLIRVSVTDKDAKRAAAMANGYVDEYRKFSATVAVTEAAQRRLFFEQQLAQAKDSLANAEEALKLTEQRTGLIQLDGQARAVIESVAQLRAQVAAKEVQIGAMRQFATDQNPDLQLAEEELSGLQAQLSHMGAGQNGGSGDLLMPKGSVPQAGLDYVRKLRDVKYNETIFELLAKQYEAAKIDEARQGVVVQVLDRAVEPDKKASPHRLLIIACAAIAGFLIAACWSLISVGLSFARRDPLQRQRLEALASSFGQG